MNNVKLFPIIMMTLVLSSVIYLSGFSKNESLFINSYKVEENLQDNRTTYPYVVYTDSSTWYLSKDDIELLGEENYYAGLKEIVRDMERIYSGRDSPG